jgi:hypothetical protein
VSGVDGDGILWDWKDEAELDEEEVLRSREMVVLVYMRGARHCTGCIWGSLSGSEASQVGSRAPGKGEVEGGGLGASRLWL